MSTKAQTYIPRHANLDEFDLIRGQILLGRRLRDIQILENSIARFGLLSPLIALKKSKRLTVIDGRKRLTAIRRLEFQGRLPSSLSRLPYFFAHETEKTEPIASALLSNSSLFDAVQAEFQRGTSSGTIADRFQISRQCVRDILSLSRLSPMVRMAFFDRSIDLPQTRAYAAIPSLYEQDICLMRLGKGATPKQILNENRLSHP